MTTTNRAHTITSLVREFYEDTDDTLQKSLAQAYKNVVQEPLSAVGRGAGWTLKTGAEGIHQAMHFAGDQAYKYPTAAGAAAIGAGYLIRKRAKNRPRYAS